MKSLDRTIADPGYIICIDCSGTGICFECDGNATLESGRLCRTCSGRRYCVFCKHTGQVPSREPPAPVVAKPPGVLRARSAYETRLYFEVHPHDCGEVRFPVRSSVSRTDAGLIATYEGNCPRCGKQRHVEFVLDETMPGPGIWFGGPMPSTILEPHDFLAVADRSAMQVPERVGDVPDAALRTARDQLELATAAIDEVLKFIPAGHEQVPVTAFTSAAGKEAYLREPGRFDRVRLEAVRGVYADGYTELVREIGRRTTS